MGHLRQRLSEFVVGLMFGIGLIISGMTDPGKVLAFLDPFGSWDPSLAFVMGGAIAVGFFAFSIAKRRTTSLLGDAIHLPTSNQIDKRLVGGHFYSVPVGDWQVSVRAQVLSPWPQERSKQPSLLDH